MTESHPAHVYRVDKFDVPVEAIDEVLSNVRRTHDLLRDQPGFVQDLVLEQSGGPGRFNLVTIVEWESQEAIEDAKDAVRAMHERIGFDPQELITRFEIEADLATYTRLDD
ncbi:antibiotic biosynthesis monooxygenase family protein [Halosolutus gelatinilyticus]|uniref:antibiotic biosynthesis monooxygenase family protein n=1 Tax=Halosolutus gelatinilyticus TaxID=2931975 RepID=UPI001FF24304|nr:antibiotic biosynthesis monooxygenase [Halosolutus gelatinilyticus]